MSSSQYVHRENIGFAPKNAKKLKKVLVIVIIDVLCVGATHSVNCECKSEELHAAAKNQNSRVP